MKSLEDLERAFDRGLNAWESEIVAAHAKKMGKKVVREVKRETKVVTGNLRRRWDSRVEKEDGGVRGGRTVGYAEGRHMLEKGISAYQGTYMRDDLQGMVDDLGKKMRG